MTAVRAGEVRLLHVLILLVVVGAVGAVVLAFAGIIALPYLNKKELNQLVDDTTNAATGFTPAKTPTQAMDRFQDAIQKRKYKSAALYVTKAYAEQLERGHEGGAQLGADEIDHIARYADNKQIKSDKLAYFLHQLDPFPKNFKTGPAPETKGDKAYGAYVFEAVLSKVTPADLKDLDVAMLNTDLRAPALLGKIELVKEGEEWKLHVPVDAAFQAQVSHFKDHWKTYHTGLHSLSENLTRDQWDTKSALEHEVLAKLRAAKD